MPSFPDAHAVREGGKPSGPGRCEGGPYPRLGAGVGVNGAAAKVSCGEAATTPRTIHVRDEKAVEPFQYGH
jgi:hypothetical protein